MSLINYQGDSKLLKRICQLLKVTDVQDGEGHSLVGSDGIAVVTGGGGSSTLSGLSDVDTSGVSSGDVLAYNGTSQKWEDKTLASVAMSGSYNDLSNTPTIPAAQVNSDWNASSGVAQILNKPTIPDELADLSDDSTHRLVTDTEKTAWSAKVDDNPTFSEASTRANIDSGDSFATILGKIKKFFTDLKTVAFTGSYSDLSNQPTIPSVSANPSTTTATLSGIEIDGTNYAVQSGSANVQSDWNQTDTTADDYIKNKPTIPSAQVNSDWNSSSGVSQILNKPTNVSAFSNDAGYLASSGLPNAIQNLSIADFSGAGSSSTYCYLCRITINSTYINGPTEIILCERGRAITSRICIFWKSVNSTDPGLDGFYVILGHHIDIWMVKAAASTWDLYVRKNENWSSISVKNVYLYGGITITWKMENASLPSGGTQATDYIGSKIDSSVNTYCLLHNGKLVIKKNGSEVATFSANESSVNTINADIACNKTEFATQTFEFNVSISAGGDGVYYPNITKSGWTPLGIVGVYTGGTILCALRWGVTSNTGARVDIHNYYSTTASGKASITVLYYKNT